MYYLNFNSAETAEAYFFLLGQSLRVTFDFPSGFLVTQDVLSDLLQLNRYHSKEILS